MPTSTIPIKIDKITTPGFSIDDFETEIAFNATPVSVSVDKHQESFHIQYIGRFSENKSQFEGKRIHHTTEHCFTYTGMFMIFTDADGNTLLKPPEEPSIATLKEEALNDNTVSITHFGYFVNLTPFGDGIETKKIVKHNGTHCITKKGNFVDKSIQGPYKQTLISFTTKDEVTYHVTTSYQFESEPHPEDESIYGEVKRSILALDSLNQKEQDVIIHQKGTFTYSKNMTNTIKDDYEEFRLTQGEFTKNYHDGTVLTSEGTFIFKDRVLSLDNSLSPHIKSYKLVSIEKEVFQHTEGVFRKNILIEGFHLTRFKQYPDNFVSCYEGKLGLQENTDNPDGLLCLYNYTNKKFIAFHGVGVDRPRNSWFEIELNNTHQIISVAALTSKDSCNCCLKAKTSAIGTVVACLTFTTPTTAKTLWKMQRDAMGQWTRIKASSTKTPSIDPEQITLWNRLEKIAIFMTIAQPFIAQPLLEKQKNIKKENVAAKLAEEEAAAESARDLLLSEQPKKNKNKTSQKNQPQPKLSISSKKNHSIKLTVVDNSALDVPRHVEVQKTKTQQPIVTIDNEEEVDDIDIEVSTILTTSSDTISNTPQKPIHYPTPIGEEKRSSSLLPGEVRTPFMDPPTPIPFWSDV